MLNSKQRAFLRSLASTADTVYQVGKGGIGEELCRGLSDALDARERIKIRVLENSGYTAKEAAAQIAEALGADVVTTVGSKVVLYRRSSRELKRRIELP